MNSVNVDGVFHQTTFLIVPKDDLPNGLPRFADEHQLLGVGYLARAKNCACSSKKLGGDASALFGSPEQA